MSYRPSPSTPAESQEEHGIRTLFIGLNYVPERSGIAPYTAGMAEFLAARAHEVFVITSFPHYPDWRFVDGAPPRKRVEARSGVAVERRRHFLPRPSSSFSRVLSELSFGLTALRARWHSPEVVVLVSPALFSNLLLLPYLLIARVPFVVWVQDLYGLGVQETGGGDRLGRTISAVEGLLLRRAHGVVAIHEQMAGSVVDLGVPRDRISVVRNWSHVTGVQDANRGEVRLSLGWSDDEVVVLHTGNMGQKQDLLNVVDAARRAGESGSSVRFVLVGDGAERAAIEHAAKGVDRFELRPPLEAEDYRRTLQAADVLLVNEHPGLRGMALPSKLTSYFTSGTPVLAATSADSATASELRRSGAGVRVDPGDPAALLEAVEQLVSDADTVRALVEAASHYHREVLGAGVAGAAFEAVLDRVTRRGRPGSVADDESPEVRGPSVLAARAQNGDSGPGQ